MDDFDTFKATREKMDPSTRKLSEHQWQQAYAAYRHARGRVTSGAGGSSEPKSGASTKKRRRSSAAASQAVGRGAHRPSTVSELAQLRHIVREKSAYADLRLIIDIMAWLVIAVVVLAGVLTLLYYTSVPATLASILGTCVQVIGVVVARLLVQVFIDIPDIALYRLQRERLERSEPSEQLQNSES